MKTVIAVAWREIVARRLAWPVALGMGLVPFLTPLVMVDAHDRATAPAEMAFAMFMGSWLAPLLVGLSLLGPDLAEGRVRFWLARPVAPGALVAGKLGAGVIVGLTAQLLTMAPAALRAGVTLPSFHALGAGLLLSLLLLGVGVVVGVVARSGSRWALVDLVGFVTVVLCTVRGFSRPGEQLAAPVATMVAAVVALFAAVAVGMSRGRIDRVRVHHALSATLWPALLPAIALLLL
jgi:hypothetical protein